MKLTADEFTCAIGRDPDWCAKLGDTKVEITTPCIMPGRLFHCLSPNITFSGKDSQGVCADFTGCDDLIDASATYKGKVILSRTGITTTYGVNILEPDDKGDALECIQCEFLKEVTGKMPGAVNISFNDALETTAGLQVTQSNNRGIAALICCCPVLDAAEGQYFGSVNYTRSAVRHSRNLQVIGFDKKGFAAIFDKCENLEELSGSFAGIVTAIDSALRKTTHLTIRITARPEGATEVIPLAADFKKCFEMKIAEGDYEGGYVIYDNANIVKFGTFKAAKIHIMDCNELKHCPDQYLKLAIGDVKTLNRLFNSIEARKALKVKPIEIS